MQPTQTIQAWGPAKPLESPSLHEQPTKGTHDGRKKILFVDDCPRVLQGLARLLRAQRKEWNLQFAESGKQALAMLNDENFDVVVTDVRMPGMNGAELLSLVRDVSPSTVRIVLTGFAETESLMQSVLVSHQFLTKPCSAEHLTDVVRRACALEELLSSRALRAVVGRVDRIPTLPTTFRQLTQAMAEEETDLDEVGRIVECDMGLAAKILQLVNSSFFGLQREVRSLREAVMYVGTTTIRSLALSFRVFDSLKPESMPKGFSMRRQQKRSILSARIAKEILGKTPEADQAFLSSMLQDVGTLIFASQLGPEWQQAVERRSVTGEPLDVAERETIGASHAEVGAFLLGLWGLPYPIVEAIAYHHDPSNLVALGGASVIAATHVAGVIASELIGDDGASPTLDASTVASLGPDFDIDVMREHAADIAAQSPNFD